MCLTICLFNYFIVQVIFFTISLLSVVDQRLTYIGDTIDIRVLGTLVLDKFRFVTNPLKSLVHFKHLDRFVYV